ncbi:MAG: ABC transporter substrate-binding protein [Anaerolineae bacterium]|nr:ABC transporter substrate-binding protein [Anaerolineae bacterium]
MRTSRLFVLIASLALLAVLSLSAAAQSEPIVIDFYYPSAIGDNVATIMDRYVAQFEEANPGIDINPVYAGSYTQTRDTIQTELNGGGAGPDVAVMLSTDLLSFIEEGHILPVQSYIDASDDPAAWVGDFFPALLLNSYDADGALWSVPFQRSTPILYYNADMLAEAGYAEAPKNRDELLEIAQALTLPNGERWGLLVPFAGGFPIWMFQSFAIASGRNIVGDTFTDVYLSDPAVVSAAEFSRALGTEYGVGPVGGSVWGDTPTAFIAGQAAMIYHTTGSLTRILNEAPFQVGVGYLPSGPAGADGTGYGAPTGGGNLYIFNPVGQERSQEELDAAWQWVTFLSSPEVQADWGAATGYVAARVSAWDLDPLKSLAAEKPQYGVARDQLAFASREFTSYRAIDTQNIINTTLSAIISGAEPDAAAALASAQEQIDALLAEYK